MPIFQFRCQTCENVFDELVRRADDRPDACPTCGGTQLAKQFSAFAVGKTAAAFPASCDVGPACPSAGSCASGGCPL